MQLKKRLLVLALSIFLVLPGVLFSPALPVSAGSSELYGTGSADEINIIRLLDMALNKGGMSMSPATIQAFLNFWWQSVQADLNKCISNVDTSITGTEAFVDALDAALESADHYEQLGTIIKKYVQFVMTLEYKSLSDFKQLLTQQGTFRRFLLSYVTDQDGNIVGTVDNKLAKYQLGKGFVSMVRQAADAYIEEYEGYYLIGTKTLSDLSPTYFGNKADYDACHKIISTITDDMVIYSYRYAYSTTQYKFLDVSDDCFVLYGTFNDFQIIFNIYDANWTLAKIPCLNYEYNSNGVISDVFDLSDIVNSQEFQDGGRSFSYFPTSYPYWNQNYTYGWIYTKDGRPIKLWKSLNAYKLYSVGKQNVYYTKDYSDFDESKDVGYTFTGTQYNGGYSHDIIQTTIDNSSEVNESTINNIVNNYITNNYGDTSGSGSGSGGDSSGSGDDWWNVGDGISAIVKGIAQLLDFLLKLLGDLIGVISDFLVGLLAVLEKLGAVGSSFGDFLKAFFGFLPEDVVNLLVVSIGLVAVAGVIRAVKG